MSRFVFTMMFLFAGSLTGAAPRDVFAEQDFGVGEIEFTGGKYEKEKFTYLILPPLKIEEGQKYPLLFFMHGAGERGNDVEKLLPHLPTQMSKEEWIGKYPCFMVIPQCRDGERWVEQNWNDKESAPIVEKPSDQMQMAMAVLDQSLKTLPIDRSRIYLTGLSMGGFGSWELAMRRPELFAAVAPVCGGGDETQAARLKNIPIWAAHGDADTVVWPVRSRSMVEAIKAVGGNVKYTEYPGVGHNSWTPFYSDPAGVLAWMFQQRKQPAKE
jgi:predicted peptidase